VPLVRLKDYIKPHHVKSTLWDVTSLYPYLREEDKREVETLGLTSEMALCRAYLDSSVCRTIINGRGCPVAMFGVVPFGDFSGIVWMLGNKLLLQMKTAFLKECREEVIKLNNIYPHLFNMIDSRNEVHIRWIKWCGFKIIGERIINNVKFYEFCRVAHV
tara:strand:- start:207 stop:686 length:480 start_codon:yes stop_codon:yes gene_type:complete